MQPDRQPVGRSPLIFSRPDNIRSGDNTVRKRQVKHHIVTELCALPYRIVKRGTGDNRNIECRNNVTRVQVFALVRRYRVRGEHERGSVVHGGLVVAVLGRGTCGGVRDTACARNEMIAEVPPAAGSLRR